MRRATRIKVACASLPISLLLGTSAVFIGDSSTWLYRHGWIAWLGFYAAAMAVTYVAVALIPKESFVLRACGGGLLTAFLAAGFVVGAFLVFALGIGDRSVADITEHSELTLRESLVFQFVATGIVGAFLGAMTGMVRSYLDNAGNKVPIVPSGSESAPHFS